MTYLHQPIIIVSLLLLPALGYSQTSLEPGSQEADVIIDAIPFKGQMTETIEDLHTQFAQNPFGLPPAKNQQLMDQFMESFHPEELLQDAQASFRRNFSSDHADSTAQWLQTEAVRPVLEAENEYYSLQGIRKRVVNRYELEQTPPEEHRMQLIEMLGQNKSAVETEVESQIIIFRALVTAFSELSDAQTFDQNQIDGIVGNFQSQASQQIQQEVNDQLLLMYHGIDEEALEEYVQFFDTGAGSWFRETKATAMHEAYETASERFLNAIQQL